MNMFMLSGYVKKVKVNIEPHFAILTINHQKQYFSSFSFIPELTAKIANIQEGQYVTVIGKLFMRKPKEGFPVLTMHLKHLYIERKTHSGEVTTPPPPKQATEAEIDIPF